MQTSQISILPLYATRNWRQLLNEMRLCYVSYLQTLKVLQPSDYSSLSVEIKWFRSENVLPADEISVVIHNIHALDVMCAAQWVIRSSYINVENFANTRENY